jgi:hypothetical protein
MLICQASSVRTTRTSRLDLPSVSRSFELFSVASVRMSQQHVRTPFSARQVNKILSKTQIWEDSCKPSGCQVYTVRTLSLIRQVVQKMFNHLDVSLHSPDARATPSERSPIQERIISKFGKSVAQLSVRKPSATVRTPPKENRLSINLGLL